MKIGIIGSGGREHAICISLKNSNKINKLFCFPGNAGTKEIAENIDIDTNDFESIKNFIIDNSIDLVVVGPEQPLVGGLVDYLEKFKIKVFGPNKKASQLEGSKIFMKNLCTKFNIPAARYAEINDIESAHEALKNFKEPIVVKSDGLAAGKGVTICENKDDAIEDIKNILDGKFKSSKKVIIEEFLDGEEASYFVITDGTNFKQIGTAQDHKRIGEGDTGLNTGGMGAYSPSLLINEEIEKKIINKIILPTIKGMKQLGCKYKGILYAGLMIKNNEPKLIEYNIRFGDPECQALMLRLEDDLLDIILSSIDEKLDKKPIKWNQNPSITIVAASKGYPGIYETKKEIKNLPKSYNKNEYIFHAGTTEIDGKVFTNGGRVLNSTVSLPSMKASRDRAIELLNQVVWENKYFRKDIGWRVIK